MAMVGSKKVNALLTVSAPRNSGSIKYTVAAIVSV